MRRQLWITRLLAACTGLCAGVAAGLLVTDGDVLVLAAAASCVTAALGVSYVLLPREARRDVLPLVAFATLLRVMAAVVLYDGLMAAGRGGFVTGDDAGYFDLSSRLARIFHGGSAAFNYGTESYLLGTFVYLEAGVFYVFGPKVLLVELLNAAMGGLLVTFAFEIARRLFGPRDGLLAAILVAVYPSLVLWSALNLKDSLALLLISVVLWLVTLFHKRPSLWLLPASFGPLLLMESLRNYIFVGLAVVIPASVVLAPRVVTRERVVTSIVAIGLAALLLGYHFSGGQRGIPSLSEFESGRAAMGNAANTSYLCEPILGTERGPFPRTLGALPCAFGYVLFAPFPWAVTRALDLLVLPEMLLWYAALAGAVFVLVRLRRSWRSLAPIVLFVGGTMLVFALAEGNVGTLFRHRAMVVPFVLILASPALVFALGRSARQSADADPSRVLPVAATRSEGGR